jgi:hypothetical protein
MEGECAVSFHCFLPITIFKNQTEQINEGNNNCIPRKTKTHRGRAYDFPPTGTTVTATTTIKSPYFSSKPPDNNKKKKAVPFV